MFNSNLDKRYLDILDEKIVEEGMKRKLGARGLRGIMEDIMNKAMFEMPGSDVKELKITKKYVEKILK